jgi:2-methylcitrate dehydratase PrpD
MVTATHQNRLSKARLIQRALGSVVGEVDLATVPVGAPQLAGVISMNATAVLCDYVAALRWRDLPPQVQKTAKWCLADWFACAIAGSVQETSLAVLEAGSSWAGMDQCTAIGAPQRYPVEAAAFFNAFASEVLEFGHGHADGGGHLGAPTIPVALALGEKGDLDAEEVLAAIVVGYEVFSRIGGAVSPSLLENGSISTGLCGALGAAASAGRATRLTPKQMAGSFGAAAYLAPVSLLSEYYATVNSAEAAQAAWVGLVASRLGAAGLTGSEDPVSALCERFGSVRRLHKYVAELGQVFEGTNLYFKPYPGCRFTHGPLEAMSQLLNETPIRSEEIKRITIHVTPSSLHLCGKYTTAGASFVQAQFSIPYVVATLILDGEVSVRSFSSERLSRETTHRFARERIKVGTGWSDEDEVDLAAAEIEILMHSGRREAARVLEPKGSPRNPLTEDDLRVKFLALTQHHLGREGAERLLQQIHDLSTVDNGGVRMLLEIVQANLGLAGLSMERAVRCGMGGR